MAIELFMFLCPLVKAVLVFGLRQCIPNVILPQVNKGSCYFQNHCIAKDDSLFNNKKHMKMKCKRIHSSCINIFKLTNDSRIFVKKGSLERFTTTSFSQHDYIDVASDLKFWEKHYFLRRKHLWICKLQEHHLFFRTVAETMDAPT